MLIQNIGEGKNGTPENDQIGIQSIWDNPKFILYVHHDYSLYLTLERAAI